MDGLREFDKRSRHFLLGDQFITSHNHSSWQCMDIIGENCFLSLLALKGLRLVSVEEDSLWFWEICVSKAQSFTAVSVKREKLAKAVLFTLKLRLFLLPFKVFFFLQSANGLKVYLKSSECLKTETVVNVGAICQYNYSGERSVFINKQDQFFSQG